MKQIRLQGLLLINIGSPSQPSIAAVRRFLTDFLSDKRVVELPSWLWQPLLRAVILPFRAKRSAKLYQSIWTEKGSPLIAHSMDLVKKLQQVLGDQCQVVLGMRYGQPSIPDALHQLLQAGASKISVLPLYPQYSAATTGSSFDAVSHWLEKQRFIPNICFHAYYYDQPFYIAALAQSLRQYWQTHGNAAYLLFSFHGLPKRASKLGDPYEKQCHVTANLLANCLKLTSKQYQIVFQSRFGKSRWLQPYCEEVLQELPKKGIKQVAVMCPGFAVDCLETLEEIDQRYRKLFLAAGGHSFHYIPALNATESHVHVINKLFNN